MASGGYDGSIRVDTRVDTKNFNAGIRSMMGSLKGLMAAVGLAFGIGAITVFGKSAVSAASDLAAAMTGLKSVLDGTGKSFAEGKKFIDSYIADGLVPATNAITAYKNLALRGYNTEQIEKTLIALKDSAAFGRQASLSMGQAVQSASEGLKNENSILVDNAGVTKNVSVMWKEYAKSIGTTADKLTKQQKIQAEVNGIMQETRFQTGDAAKYVGQYAGMVAGLSMSFYNLKVAVGNAIIPVLAQIIPVIKTVVDWLVVLANQFAQVMNVLFGVDLGTQAVTDSTQDATDAANDQADALKNAEKAAKGALAAFDELNVLQSDKDDQGGALTPDAITPVITPAEETTNGLKAKIEELKAAFLDLFGPAIDSAGRLVEALKPLAQNIWEGLKWAWDNILVPLGEWVITDLLPAFLDLLAGAITVLNSVLEALKPLALALFENFLKPIAKWSGDKIIEALKWLTDRLYDLSDWIDNHQGTVQKIAIVLGIFALAWGAVTLVATAWSVIAGIATVVTTAFGIAVAILTSPITLVILAIIALIVVIYLLYTHWDDVKKKAKEVWDEIKEQWGYVKEWFAEHVLEPLKERFYNAWEDIKKWPASAWEWIKEKWEGAKEWFQTTVIDPIKTGFDTALAAIKLAFETTFTNIKTFVKGIVNSVITLLNGMIAAIISGINAAIGALNSLKIDIPGFDAGPLGSFGGYSFGLSLPALVAPQIPLLARGAIIPPNAAFAAVLGDQTSGRNLEAPEGLIRQIIREEMGQRQDNINITFEGSLGELVRLLRPHIERETTRVGGSLIQSGVTS